MSALFHEETLSEWRPDLLQSCVQSLFKEICMKSLLFVFTVCVLLSFASCSETKTVDDGAVRAAKEYYDSLLAGNQSFFVRGMYLPERVPPSYKSQLEANAKMFLADVKEKHGGIHEVRAVNCINDTVLSASGKIVRRTSNAFILLCFNDSLKEEIVVPMVEKEGRWLMK